jgi:hypothetical protein
VECHLPHVLLNVLHLTETQIIGQHDPQAVLEEFPVVRTKRRKKKVWKLFGSNLMRPKKFREMSSFVNLKQTCSFEFGRTVGGDLDREATTTIPCRNGPCP